MIFYGWRVVAAAFVALFTAYGAQYCFSVFFSALLDEFGWSRGGLAGVFSLYAFGYCLVGFPAGRLTDRWGPRAVVTIGAVFLGGALTAMALVQELWQPYLIYGVVGAIGMGTAYVPCNGTVVKWFARQRGLAVGIASAGASLGTFALPPVAHLTVARLGWRAAYVVFGVGVFAVLSVAAIAMRRGPALDGPSAGWRRRPFGSRLRAGRGRLEPAAGRSHARTLADRRRVHGDVAGGLHSPGPPGTARRPGGPSP